MLTVREQASCQLRDVVVSLRHSRTFVGPLLSGEGCRDEIKVPLGPTHMNLRQHAGWDSIPSFCYQGMRFHVLSPAFVVWMLGFGIWDFGCKQRARLHCIVDVQASLRHLKVGAAHDRGIRPAASQRKDLPGDRAA